VTLGVALKWLKIGTVLNTDIQLQIPIGDDKIRYYYLLQQDTSSLNLVIIILIILKPIIIIIIIIIIMTTTNKYMYRPLTVSRRLRLPDFQTFDKVVSPIHRPLLSPQEIFLVLISTGIES
jgi:hypothetical protein